ncbi:MAG: hypothetical protein CM15mP1_1940 [Methanobacteriota archaeon]|nr:MAG: hypothetical protein CM15mP1_1940 [Euryarchaeota archaeon]
MEIKTWGGKGRFILFAEFEEFDWMEFDDGPEADIGETYTNRILVVLKNTSDFLCYGYVEITFMPIQPSKYLNNCYMG